MYEYWNIDWLAHHGILNQRWGHRNGPPYPLSSDVSTGQRLKKGAAGSIKKKTPKSGSGRVTKGMPADKVYVKRPDNLSEVDLKKSPDNKEEPPVGRYKDPVVKEFYEKELKNVKEPNQLKGDRLNEAATLGIKAMQELGDRDVQLDDNWKDWFVYEDQTIGLATVADLINQGKTKKQIKDLIDYADNLDYDRAYDGPVFELTEAKRHYYPKIDSFIDACLKVKESEKNQNKNISPEISKSVDDQKINKDQFGYLNINVKNDKKDTPLHVFTDPDTGGNEDTLRNATKNILSNKQKIKDLAFEAIKEDPYILKDWKPEGMSDKTFLNNLDIRSAYVTPDGGVEISIYGKNDNVQDMLGGHSLDVEFDLNNLKKPSWVAVNG